MKDVSSTAKWIIVLSAVWLLLTEGNLVSWTIGLPFIVISILLRSRYEISEKSQFETNNSTSALTKKSFSKILGLIQFGYFFIVESIRGGIDVSCRVLRREIKVDPVFFDYPMQLQLTSAQQFFMGSISLLPGTLSADIMNNQLRIHSLDQQTNTTQGIKRLEHLIGKIFGETL